LSLVWARSMAIRRRYAASRGAESLPGGSSVGGFVRGAITLVLAVVLLVVIALDGYGMFVAFMNSRDLALSAAQTAAATLEQTGNEGTARKSADTYVATHGGELLQLEHGKSVAQWYRARVRVEPKTFVLKFIPVLNRYLDQESETSYTF